MTFQHLYERVRQTARDRVRNGEVTERGLARITGVSQPHIHNVLKGVRTLSTTLSDRLLAALKIEVGELVNDCPQSNQELAGVSLMTDRVGASSAEFRPEQIRGQAWVPAHLAEAIYRPVAVLVGEDFKLPPELAAGDLVILHQNIGQDRFGARPEIHSRDLYVVLTAEGPRFRHIREAGGQLFVAAAPFVRTPSEWEPVPFRYGGAICGRVAWSSRQPTWCFGADEAILIARVRETYPASHGLHAAN